VLNVKKKLYCKDTKMQRKIYHKDSQRFSKTHKECKSFYKINTFAEKSVVEKLRITATSYLNTLPFVYGIRNSGYLKNYVLDLEVPSVCSKNLMEGKADIALIPLGALPETGNDFEIIYNYCLGANGKVKTVVLLSRVPLEKIREVYLDFESGTSVRLVKVLAEKYWKLSAVKWHNLESGIGYRVSSNRFSDYESIVAIGDKTFELIGQYEYVYDLAEEWYKFTSLPFVFACWVKRKDIADETIKLFNKAIEYGIQNKLEAVREYKKTNGIDVDLEEYVEKYLSYEFDALKQEGMKKFLKFIGSMVH
jgi:chorismate dehydratase